MLPPSLIFTFRAPFSCLFSLNKNKHFRICALSVVFAIAVPIFYPRSEFALRTIFSTGGSLSGIQNVRAPRMKISRSKLHGTNSYPRFLQKLAVSCGLLRKSAVLCGCLENKRKSCKFQESVKMFAKKNCEFGSIRPFTKQNVDRILEKVHLSRGFIGVELHPELQE